MSEDGDTPLKAPHQDIVKRESKTIRALYALPLLGILYGCHRTMGTALGKLEPIFADGGTKVDLGNGVVTSFCPRFTGASGLDGFLSMYAAFFTPSIGNFDPVGRLQAIAFLADLVPLQAIWMVEGIRRGNVGTVAYSARTVLSLLFQIQGIGFLAPIYYFIHYVQSPVENYATAEDRMTKISSAKTIIPTIAISYILPSVSMFVVPGLINRQWINGLFFQPFPIYAAVVQRVLNRFVTGPTVSHPINSPEADMPYLQRAYRLAAQTSGCVYLYLWIASPFPLVSILFKDIGNPSAAMPLIEGAAKVLRYDHIAAFSAGAVWTLLSFWDLKRAGILNASWWKIVRYFAGVTIVGGPGAGMALMWAWREEVLAERNTVGRKG